MKVGTPGCSSTTEPPYLDSFQVKNGMLWIGITRESNIIPPQQNQFSCNYPTFGGGRFWGLLLGRFPTSSPPSQGTRIHHRFAKRNDSVRCQTSDVSTAHSKVFVLRTNCIRLFLLKTFLSMMVSDDPNLSKEKGKVWYFWKLLVYCFVLGTTFFRSL